MKEKRASHPPKDKELTVFLGWLLIVVCFTILAGLQWVGWL
jgi:hypothetical protein